MKRNVKLGALIVSGLCALAASFGIGFSGGRAVAEDGETALALKPIEDNSEIAYHYFDAPSSVFADDLGMLVAGNSLERVAAGTFAVTRQDIAADKAQRYHTGDSEYIVALRDGSLSVVDGEAVYDGDIVDFAIDGTKLYAASENTLTVMDLNPTAFDVSSAVTVELDTGIYPATHVTKLTVTDGEVFVAVDANSRKKQDVFYVSTDGAMTQVLKQTNSVMSLASLRYDGETVVYTLTRDKITGYAYNPSRGGLVEKYRDSGAETCDIYAYDGALYAISTVDSLRTISADLHSSKTLIASADDSRGFFYMPTSAAVKNSQLYVTDSMNERIAIYGKTLNYVDFRYLDDSWDNPSSVVCDSGNTLYVAYGNNTIGVIKGDELKKFGIDGEIKQLASSADNKLYVLADTGLWVMDTKALEPPTLISETRYKAITLSVGRDELYAMDDTGVFKLTYHENETELNDKVEAEKYCDAVSGAFSFAVDLGGNVFMLATDKVYRIANDDASTLSSFSLTLDGSSYSLGLSCGQILLSTVGNSFVNYGDAIIVDTFKHRLFTVGGGDDGLMVKLVDDDYEVPDLNVDDEPRLYDAENDARIIRTARYTVEVFEKPMESPSIYTIAEGRKVIVPQYDIADAQEFSLVLIDDLDASHGSLILGYVYKNALSEPLEYEEPPAAVGAVYAGATPIYMWPSRKATTVNGYSAVEQNTELGVLSFVKSYRDEYDITWYRVSFGAGRQYDGYIMANSLSLMGYDPHIIRPAYDAVIISYKNSSFADAYRMENGVMKLIEGLTLPTGTQVEIVGKFDSSETYTQVKYLDEELGTFTCYVRTEYVKYKGVNTLLLVAVIVIVVTVILGIVIVGRVIYLKRKRLTGKEDR